MPGVSITQPSPALGVEQLQGDRRRRGVPAAAGDDVDVTGRRGRRSGTRALTRVDLPTPRRPTKHGDPAAQRRRAPERGRRRGGATTWATPRAAVRVEQRRGVGEVGLGHARAAGHPARRRRRPGRGRSAGSAARGRRAATTMASWSALATTTRSTGSVSSAVRRRTVRARLDADDAGQGVRRRRTGRRRRRPVADDDALAAELAGLHGGDHAARRSPVARPRRCSRPRSTATTKPSPASSCPGRTLVRGRDLPRCGRTRTSSSSRRVGRAGSGVIRRASPATASAKPGSVLAVVATSSTIDPGHAQAEHRAGRRHPVVVVGVRTRLRAAARARSAGRRPSRWTRPPRALSSVDEGRQPVGLVAAQVRRCREGAWRSRPARPARPASGASSPTSGRSTSTPRTAAVAGDGQAARRRGDASAPPSTRRSAAQVVARLGRGERPVGHGDPAAGDHRGGQERRGVGEVGLDRRRRSARTGPGATVQSAAGRGRSTGTPPRSRSIGSVIVDVRQRRDRRPRCSSATPVVEAATDQQQRGDELAGGRGVDHDAAAAHRGRSPCTVNGSAPRPSSSMVDAERAQGRRCIGPIGRCRAARVAVEARPARRPARPAAARSASRCRPGRSRRSPAPRSGAGVTRQSRALGPGRRRRCRCRGARSACGHQHGVARAQRAADEASARRPSAARISARLVSDFDPGTRDDGVHRARSPTGAGHGWGHVAAFSAGAHQSQRSGWPRGSWQAGAHVRSVRGERAARIELRRGVRGRAGRLPDQGDGGARARLQRRADQAGRPAI